MNKKRIAILLCVLTLTMAALPFFAAYANRNPIVTLDGYLITFPDQNPIMDNNRVLVPVRGVFEKMGFYVTWNAETRVARLESDTLIITIPADSNSFTISNNGFGHNAIQIITPDVPQRMVNNRMLLPLRAVAEAVGATANWDSNNRVAQIISPPQPSPGPVWAVQPNLPHDHITLCNAGNYVNSQRRVIDPQTGQLTGDFCDGHGGPPPDFVFDPERLLFGHSSYGDAYHFAVGMHTMEDFKAREDRWVQQNSSGLIAVESVDSSLRQSSLRQSDYSEYWWLTEEAFSGRFALMYNLQFVTGFIFDDAPSWWHRYRFALDENTWEHSMVDMQFIAVSMEGMWGLVNKSGDVIIPFIFENLILINENTAFANYNGRHGILDIPGSIAAFGGVR